MDPNPEGTLSGHQTPPLSSETLVKEEVTLPSKPARQSYEVAGGKSFPFLPLILVILFLGASAATVFLYLQNMSLKSQLDELSQQIKPMPMPTPIPTSVFDATSDWEVYTDNKLGFSIKYPKNTFTIGATPGTGIGINKGPLNGVTADFQILSRGPETDPLIALKKETPICNDAAKATSPLGCNPTTEKFQINNAVGIRVTSHSGLDYYLSDSEKTKPVLRIIIDISKDDPNYGIFTQILSTFKFTDPNEAKAAECATKPKTCPTGTVCMTNPAADFCVCMGGKSTIKTATDGSQSGICTINGKVQDEWEYYHQFASSGS